MGGKGPDDNRFIAGIPVLPVANDEVVIVGPLSPVIIAPILVIICPDRGEDGRGHNGHNSEVANSSKPQQSAVSNSK